ncbi:MAG: DUF4058 family protein [Leptolyngbya sp. LCM1.Bin17]|nr:MAG: DUF4058 family protein [Leptolyngbya sp. LCM1.Bin17]
MAQVGLRPRAPNLTASGANSSEQRPQADLYAVTVRDRLPSFPLPLKGADEAVLVDLSAIVQGVCDRACSAISTTLPRVPITSRSPPSTAPGWQKNSGRN